MVRRKEGERDPGNVILLAPEAGPKGGVDDLFDCRHVREKRLEHDAALSGRLQMIREVIVDPRRDQARCQVRPVTLNHPHSIASSIPSFVCFASSVAAAFPSLPRSYRPQPE